MADIETLLNQYRKLSDYCDLFWNRIAELFPEAINCQPGCTACCQLESVNALEAYLLTIKLETVGCLRADGLQGVDAACPLLADGLCLAYEARPLICRTHGLLLNSKELRGETVSSCPLNFTDLSTIDKDFPLSLDLDMINENLMRLNLAFSLIIGDIRLADRRYPITAVIARQLPQALYPGSPP